MSFIDDAARLFGLPITAPDVEAFLRSLPSCKVQKPSDGDQYLISKAGGFEILFSEPASAARRSPDNRLLSAVFLFPSDGKDRKVFFEALPFGFSFGDHRRNLVQRRLPDRTWVNGRGRVPVTYALPSSDAWHTEGWNFYAHYDDEGCMLYAHLEPSRAFTEPFAPATWEELALTAGQRLAAIQLHRKTFGSNSVEAMRAVDEIVARQGAAVQVPREG